MTVLAILFVVVLVAALIAAERSLRRSRGGSPVKRTPEESRSLGRIMSTISRFPGGGGGGG